MIRPLAPADARAVAELEIRVWRRDYTDFVPGDRVPAIDEREDFWAIPSPGVVLVWEQDDRVVGVVSHNDRVVSALYVDPPAQGAGVGTALLARAEADLIAAGRRAATAWLFEANGQGRDFFTAKGWLADGSTGNSHGLPTVRHRKDLAAG